MLTTHRFHTTVPNDGTITLPMEFRGVPVRIVVEKESTKATARKGILALRGILKGYTTSELENARDEYLTDKYIHDQNTD
jgi:bifunctional DNA-binding transcriptional regulator/antitoxin component of YhaV-PrlF toxin-antitoxin module